EASPTLVDVVKTSGPFMKVGGSAPLPPSALDPNGWPTTDFQFKLDMKCIPVGPAVFKISGVAQQRPTIALAAQGGEIQNVQWNSSTHVFTADMIFDGNGNSLIAFTNTGGGVQDLQVLRPGYDPSNPPLFTTDSLALMGRADVLRTMVIGGTNDSTDKNWSDRPLPTAAEFYQ